MDWKFEKNMYPILDTRVEFKVKAKLTWTTRSAAVLIESDWNLKDDYPFLGTKGENSINRIRLEFKGMRRTAGRNVNGVLIESDWNLKLFSLYEIGWPVISVLIESDWNLKISTHYTQRTQLLY